MKEFLKEKILSRKFLAACAAVAGAAVGVIQWSDAVNVVLTWIAVQGVSDAVSQFKKEK